MSRRSVETYNSIRRSRIIKRISQYRDTGGKTANSYLLELTGTLENSDDAQNLRMVCEKSAHGDTQNLRMNNLVRRNLGNKTNNIDQKEKHFNKFWTTYPENR